jgi:hypothetical protein
MAEKIISSSASFSGWRFSSWFLGNWKTIKELLKVGIPAIVSYTATNGNVVLSGFLTIVGKFVLDSGEYFFKTYKK